VKQFNQSARDTHEIILTSVSPSISINEEGKKSIRSEALDQAYSLTKNASR
jgi:hypothetical protein